MTDTTTPNDSLDPLDVDIHLKLILDSLLGFKDEKHENSFGISLVTAGGNISGLAHTRHTWAQGQIDRLKSDGSEGANFLGSVLQLVEDRFFQDDDEQKDEDSIEWRRAYINLKDARVVSGGSVIEYSWLRVDMRQIIAWSLSGRESTEN